MRMNHKKRITDEYNRWVAEYRKAVESDTWSEAGLAAFMCNAINDAVHTSKREDLKEYFREYAERPD